MIETRKEKERLGGRLVQEEPSPQLPVLISLSACTACHPADTGRHSRHAVCQRGCAMKRRKKENRNRDKEGRRAAKHSLSFSYMQERQSRDFEEFLQAGADIQREAMAKAGREAPPNLLRRRKSAPASPPPLASLLVPPLPLQVQEPDGGRRAAFVSQAQNKPCPDGGAVSVPPIEQQLCESAENKFASQGAGCIENISSVRRAVITVLSCFASLIRNWRQRMARCNM